ncbi:unnamed protein product [Cylindrotheca closterium]|uniref:Uncharacterized protein n=1 Tax=Cylindrotheca closterium TaxID=2856 RepID=A0AAD2CI93_9STRA|nr:unnamed protein product [Cylindrotheca closterium]
MSESEEQAPRSSGNCLKTFCSGLTMTGGDMGSLSQLFFDNLSTLLGALFAIQDLTNFGPNAVSKGVMDEYVWGRIVPGVGITLLIGNIYYSWQAVRLTNKYGRPYTAQPYGLNTPAAFAFVFNIIYAVFFAEGGGDAGFIKGYKVALVANFITGLISILFGCFGPLILKVVPPAALLVPIAGIGFAFLGIEQVSYSIAAPIVGYSAIMWVFLGWYAGVRIGVGKYRIPEALQVILVGVILGWATGLNDPEDTKQAAELVKWWGPVWSAGDMFGDFGMVKDYLGIVIPIGISAAATTLMCLVSAKEAGDPFPVRETMIIDGIGTCIASFFGSPFGTVVYIGHPAHKASGAKVGYSLVNGIIYFIMSFFGILALIQSLVNQATIGPIVLFVGLMVNQEALDFIPSRHYPAYVIGLFPSVYDWVTNVSGRAPLTDDGTFNTNTPGGAGWIGVLGWKRGALLVSMLWVAMLVNVIDRQWKVATIWALITAMFALFGIIHVPEAGFDNFDDAFWEQCTSNGCWEFGYQWMYFVSYIILTATFALVGFASKLDSTIEDPIDDETRHAFDDWFSEASMDTTVHRKKDMKDLPPGVEKVASDEPDEKLPSDTENGDEAQA